MPPVLHRFKAFHGVALLLSLVVVAIGITVLIGWAFHIAVLKSVFPGLVTMKANTATGLLLCGLPLAILSREKVGPSLRFCIAVLAGMAIALGSLTLGEYFFGWNLGIDELLFRDAIESVGTSQPGRMSPSTAFCFVMTGSALEVASQRILLRLRFPIVSALGTTLVVIAGVGTLGQITNGLLNVRLWNYFGMAVHTAAGFILLGAGLLAYVKNEKGMTWALDKMTTIGFATAVAIMLTAAGVSWNYTNQLEKAAAWVSHTQEVLKEVEEVRGGMADLESSQRGYIITGDEHLLEQRNEIKNAVREDLDALRHLTADRSDQHLYLDGLEPLIISRINFGEQTILVRRQQGFPAAQQMLAAGTGIRLTKNINQLFLTMRDEQYGLLLTQQKQVNAISTATFLLLPLGVFLSLSILSLAVFFLNTGVDEQKQAEEKLKASLREVTDLKQALDEHAIVAITDPRGKITYVNDKFCAISQYSREELLGQDHRIINSGYHPKEFIRDLWTTITNGKVWHGEIKNRAKDESFYWVDTTIVPFLNERGQPRQYVAIRADITERKLAEEASAHLAAIVNSSNDAIIGKDLNSIVTSWNIGAEKLFGYSANEIIGQPITRLIPADRLQEEAQIIDRVKNGETVEHFDTMRMTKDARQIDIAVTVSPIKDKTGKIVGASKVARDITERKRAEQEIHELNVRLEQRVAERTAELEMTNKELEAFSYSVSHDLRAPLRAVDGFSQAVLEDYGGQLPEEGRHYLQTIREGAQRMGVLIDDLLTFSRLSRAPLKKQEVNIDKLVRHVLEDLNAQREGRRVEIRIGDLPACRGDPALLNQVWVNLLSNALKYTRHRETAVIEIGCELDQGENVYFVRDNGAGFDMRYAHKLFGVFQRLHRADEFEGTGVGLAIVQRVIHRHGGHIRGDAALDRGATFYFTLKERTPS
jgi:PAS domain S-box-containing protein